MRICGSRPLLHRAHIPPCELAARCPPLFAATDLRWRLVPRFHLLALLQQKACSQESRDELPACLGGHDKAEADIVVPILWRSVSAIRDTTVLRRVAPSAAANNAGRGPFRRIHPGTSIVRRSLVSIMPVILTPLIYISVHVAQPEFIRQQLAYRMCFTATVIFIPAHFFQLVTPRIQKPLAVYPPPEQQTPIRLLWADDRNCPLSYSVFQGKSLHRPRRLSLPAGFYL